MKRKIGVGLLVVCLWLVDRTLSAQAADMAHFEALNLVRLPQAVALPDISLPNLDGKQVSLRAFQGKVVLLNFWATW